MQRFFHFHPCSYALILIMTLSMHSYGQKGHKKLANEAQKCLKVLEYVCATKRAIASIRIKNDFAKSQKIYYEAFPEAVKFLKRKIDRHSRAASVFSGDQTVRDCETMIEAYETLIELTNEAMNLDIANCRKCPKPPKWEYGSYFKPLNEARTKLTQAKESTAELHYSRAKQLMEEGGLANNKKAARKLLMALGHVPGYKDAGRLQSEAREAGTTRIAILPFENKSGKGHYGAIGEIISDEIIRQIFPGSVEFLVVVDSDQIKQRMYTQNMRSSGEVDDFEAVKLGKSLGVTHVLTGQINQIISQEEPVIEKKYVQTKSVVVDQVEYINDKGKQRTRNIYGDVSVEIHEYIRKGHSSMQGSFKIVAVENAKVEVRDSFSEQQGFSVSWGKGYGDSRALTPMATKLINTPVSYLPPEETMVTQVGSKVSLSLAERVRRFAQ